MCTAPRVRRSASGPRAGIAGDSTVSPRLAGEAVPSRRPHGRPAVGSRGQRDARGSRGRRSPDAWSVAERATEGADDARSVVGRPESLECDRWPRRSPCELLPPLPSARARRQPAAGRTGDPPQHQRQRPGDPRIRSQRSAGSRTDSSAARDTSSRATSDQPGSGGAEQVIADLQWSRQVRLRGWKRAASIMACRPCT
jgi:hypothetical protein